jgi:multiple sugar transport system substrate-binding protein
LEAVKKIAYSLGITAIIVLLVWDIPFGEQAPEGRETIRYWFITGAKEEVPFHARKFNRMQDSIYIETTAVPWTEHEKKILTGILSGNPPDVIQQVTPVVKWASRMALVPLDEYIYRDNLDTTIFFPSLWEEMKWEGSVYALPVNSASYAFVYNKRLFLEAGLDPENPPRTWNDVVEYNRLLTRRDERGRITRMGFIPHYGNLQTSILMAWQLGAEFLRDGGTRVSMKNPETVKAFRWHVDYFEEYPINDVNAFMAGFGQAEQHGFLSGRVAMMVLDSSFLDQIIRYRPDLDFGVTFIPTFDGFETASSSGSWWLAIPRGAKNPEAAWELIKLAVAKDTQLETVADMEESLFPGTREAALDPLFLTDEITEVFVRQMDYARSPSIVPMAHDVFWREFGNAQERIMFGLQTPERALSQAEWIVQRALDEALDYDRFVRQRISITDLD